MGRKTKKLKPEKLHPGTHIGELWGKAQEASIPTMASLHGGCSDFYSESSDDAEGEPLQANPKLPLNQTQPPPPAATPTPVSMEAIRELMADHHKKISADVASIRDTLQGLNGRLGAVEHTTQVQDTHIKELQQEILALRNLSKQNDLRFAELEDKRRLKHLKIRGITDTVTDSELPHFVRRLLTFQAQRDRSAVLAVARLQQTYPFEGMNLMFYADLSGATLAWRRSLQQLTSLLREKHVIYRWGPAHTLTVTKGEDTHKIHCIQEAPMILGLLGLPQNALTQPTPKDRPRNPPSWETASAAEFVPRRQKESPTVTATT
ncbi:Hypothetical predicted protein [Pelobates cultripes]|uniref:Uncharacterized protein n=1 Tax=Pelobates cultripes TaxID=61616 RepID=A0AAD1WBR7_PELCU|nr:Hypothetical predicted protein [Pelobates cultripes]